MLVTVLLRNGFTDFYQILYAYSVGLRIGYYLFFIPLSDKGCSPLTFFFGRNFLFLFFYKVALKIHTTLNFYFFITNPYFYSHFSNLIIIIPLDN